MISCTLEPTSCTVEPIGIIHSCFTGKFGIPRQPGLAPSARAVLRLLPPYDRPEAVAGLQGVSHIWLQFIFHHNRHYQWQPTVRPPRLGGNVRRGVFATRSPMRPNAVGLSVVRLESVDCTHGVSLHLSGVDLLDGTPVIDIKPYVPYVDAIADAVNPLADKTPEIIDVRFGEAALARCRSVTTVGGLEQLIREVLQQDPRPQYKQHNETRRYGMRLYDLDVHWVYQIKDDGQWFALVTDIINLADTESP